jgi:hypothetical protein
MGFELQERPHNSALISAPYSPARQIYALWKKEVLASYAAWAAINWLPLDRPLLLFIQQTCGGPELSVVFDAIRRGCGATTLPIDTPGHLFTNTVGWDYQEFAAEDIKDEAIAMWLAGSAFQWTWEGWVAAEGSEEFVELGDGYLRFWTPNEDRMQEAEASMRQVGLRILDCSPWQ